MNWKKVLGNAGIAFFSTLVGVITVDALTGMPIKDWGIIILTPIIPAALQAGFVLCREVSEAGEKEELLVENIKIKKKRKGTCLFASCSVNKKSSKLHYITMF